MAHENREKKFTREEFSKLARYDNGDIKDDLGMACIWMTQNQIEKLTGDDQSRVFEYKEEISYMIQAEFG